MAAPHVTGTIALMMEKNPYLTHEQIASVLDSTKMANGCVDAQAAVAATPSCCQGQRGNADYSTNGLCTMGDLTVLIDYVHISSSLWLPCRDAADIDGNGRVDLADINWMVEHLFITLDPLPSCP